MIPPIARTNAEAHLYMDLHPCSCGEARFERRSAVVTIDGDLASRYTGACARCGSERRFEFRLPGEILPPLTTGVRFGGDAPSQLLDPGEWLAVADDCARRVATDGSGLDGIARGDARRLLTTAIAALDEVCKFKPPAAAEIPASAFTSARGRAIHDAEPGRFRAARLEVVRATYAEQLSRLP